MPFKKIYFFCPYAVTGGPENIHQVCQTFRMLGRESYIVYENSTEHPDKFLKYGNPIVNNVDDDEENIFVYPEYLPISAFNQFKRIRKIVFWLSVDFSYDYKNRRETINDVIKASNVYGHFAQSEYAYMFLKSIGAENIFRISDYISEEYYFGRAPIDGKRKQVVYNPVKGMEFTGRVIEKCGGIDFIPIQNMTADQVRRTLDESMLYIDFGMHPGKDRIPRAAALRNCVVLTNRTGAAANDVDIPIPGKYKIADFDTAAIHDAINGIFENYCGSMLDFINYRQTIAREKSILADACMNFTI